MAAPLSHAAICRPEHRGLVMAAAVIASSMGFIDSSVTAIALPSIRASLGGSLEAASWVAGAYLLTLSTLILVGGAMADRFGTVRVYATGIGVFVLSSAVCMLAGDMLQMNLARALQGLGAALMVPGSMTLVARAYPRDERGAALGLWAAAATATTALGPVLGGFLLSSGGPEVWRAIFALNLPLGAAALVLLRRFTLKDPGRPGAPMDLPGAGLATLTLGTLAWGLTHGSPTLLPIALLAALAFLWHEARSPAPMIRPGIFAHRGFALANLATLFLYVALTGVMFYLPMTAMSAWGISPLGVTAAFLPGSAAIALLSRKAGRLADRFGPGPLMSLGAAVAALGYLLLTLAIPDGQFFAHIVPAMALVGLGLALVVAPLTAAVMAFAPEAEQGAASGINNAVARAAGLISVALMGLVARAAYGPVAPGRPGFGLPGAEPGHVAATATAFSRVSALAAILALTASLIASRMGPGAAICRRPR